MSRSSQHIRTSTFITHNCNTTYEAFTANANAIEFVVYNATGVALDILKGSGAALILPNGATVTLKGNPSNYSCRRNSGSGTVTVTSVVYSI